MILHTFEACSEKMKCQGDKGWHFIDADVVPGFGAIVIDVGTLEQQMNERRRESTDLACQCGAVTFGAYKRGRG